MAETESLHRWTDPPGPHGWICSWHIYIFPRTKRTRWREGNLNAVSLKNENERHGKVLYGWTRRVRISVKEGDKLHFRFSWKINRGKKMTKTKTTTENSFSQLPKPWNIASRMLLKEGESLHRLGALGIVYSDLRFLTWVRWSQVIHHRTYRHQSQWTGYLTFILVPPKG